MSTSSKNRLFQHTAARRRLVPNTVRRAGGDYVSTHSRPKAAGQMVELNQNRQMVSTHSRPKAAGLQAMISTFAKFGFNTQPPEGGWEIFRFHLSFSNVSTHSRPKAAGNLQDSHHNQMFCFNTQPPEGGWGETVKTIRRPIRFNTQPPEGGWKSGAKPTTDFSLFQHTAARRRLVLLWRAGFLGR